MRKLSILIILMHILCFSQFSGGNGTENDPWLIRTPENLDSLRYFLGQEHSDKYFEQISDIDLGISPWNEGEGWEPIGTTVDSMYFFGNYDGNGQKIMNLTINRPDSSYQGLFGITNAANLYRIALSNVNITGYNYVGSLSGKSSTYNGIITECYSTGSVSGNLALGGFIGAIYTEYSGYNVVTDCFSRCSVTGLEQYIGGFTSRTGLFSWIGSCYSTGAVTGGSYDDVSGFNGSAVYDMCGHNYWDTESSGCISSSSAESRTTKEMKEYKHNTYIDWDFDNVWVNDALGIYNNNDGYPVLRSQLPKSIPSIPDSVNINIENFVVSITWNNPSLNNDGEPLEELTQIIVIKDGSTVFSNEDPNIGGEEVFSEIVSSDGIHKYYILGFNSSGTGIVKEVSVFAGNPFDGGTGTDESPYLVSTPQQLSNVRFFNKYDGKVKYFLQTNDMSLDIEPWNTGEGWEPIDDFEGVYSGDGHKITNLFINRPNNNEVGLFSESGDPGTIENLTIENGNITGHNLTGSVIGSGSRMNNIKCHNISIEGNDHLGGIAGKGYVFSNCRFEGFISGNNRIGGITSFAAELTNCYTDINISGNDYVGGMVGYSEGLNQLNISLSSSRGNITAEKSAGGFIGLYEGDSGEITDCYSRVNISGDMYIGGFSGRLSIWYGGIIDSYSTGSVTCSSSLQGGFNAYSNWDEDDVYNSYWDMEASGQTDSEGGEGRNTDEMKDPDPEYTYVGWNFQDIWRIDPLVNNGYPFLLWELTDIEDQQHLPETVMLEQNYPNPFNPLTKINYTIPSGITDNIRLDVYNSKGQLIRRLVDKKHNPGKYTVNFNASGLNSGIYFYALRTGNTVKSRKMVLLK